MNFGPPITTKVPKQYQNYPLFVYGTLRPTGFLHDSYIPKGTVSIPARAPGALFLHMSRAFPVACFDAPGVIHGDLLNVNWKHNYICDMFWMEVHAGYTPEIIRTVSGVYAVGFNWQSWVGQRIKSGDWLKFAQEMEHETFWYSKY